MRFVGKEKGMLALAHEIVSGGRLKWVDCLLGRNYRDAGEKKTCKGECGADLPLHAFGSGRAVCKECRCEREKAKYRLCGRAAAPVVKREGRLRTQRQGYASRSLRKYMNGGSVAEGLRRKQEALRERSLKAWATRRGKG